MKKQLGLSNTQKPPKSQTARGVRNVVTTVEREVVLVSGTLCFVSDVWKQLDREVMEEYDGALNR